jgi:acetate kinase
MPPVTSPAILAINAGSSSLKVTVFGSDEAMSRRAAATVEPAATHNAPVRATDFDHALDAALDQVQAHVRDDVVAVGHRIVHGGVGHTEPEPITAALLDDLRRLAPIDPTHMPQALSLVAAVEQRYPSVAQFACFDTAFHRTLPAVAQQYPLPRRTWDTGIRRYGFHGLSCESIVGQLRAIAPGEADGRLLIAHLGNGASITAVQRGASVDTSMGFSPTGGLMMGTRSGDLDPGVLIYLARTTGASPDAIERLVTEEAGLLGVSGISADMREVLRRAESPDAREAIALYCYTARKHLAALVASLHGLDAIVFTGGIGEHAPAIRAGICTGLDYLGVDLAPDRNAASDPIISRPESRVRVRVMHTDEDLVIARHVRRLLGHGARHV